MLLDLALAADRAECLALAARADIVFDSSLPGDALGLGVDRLRAARPGLVVVSLSPFGHWGPRATWRGNDLIACHSSGFAHSFPSAAGRFSRSPPLNTPTYAADFLAGQTRPRLPCTGC